MFIIWNGETTPKLDLATEIKLASQVGFGGIELFVPKLRPFFDKGTIIDLKNRLDEAGIKPAAINCIENVTFRSQQEFQLVLQECRWLAEIAQAVGCSVIDVGPGPRPLEKNWHDVVIHAAEAVSLLAESVKPYGCQIAIEFLEPQSCCIRTLAEALEIVQATGRNDIGLVLDTFHFYLGGSSWESLDSLDPGQLLVVHVNDMELIADRRPTDNDRLLPGEGVLPLTQMLSKINARGYQSGYSIEVMRPAYYTRDPLEYMTDAYHKTEAILRSAGIV